MNEKTRCQIEEMKKQTIGVEVEMNNIDRSRAAKVAAEFFGTWRFDDTARRNGYCTWSAWDAQGREFSSEPVAIHVLPNLSLSLTADAGEIHEDESLAISLTVEHGAPSTVQWAMTRDGEGVPVSLEDNGGELTFDGAGDYVLTATVTDALGKEFTATLPIRV